MNFDDILLEILDKLIWGEKVDIEVYCKKYPQFKDAILDKFRAAEFIKKNFREDDLEGKRLGEYIILQELGRGGMGVVFLGINPALARLTAIKILSPAFIQDKKALKNFQEEAKTIAKFNHPNIVPIYSIGNEKGVYFIAMGYISGQSLKVIIEMLKNKRHGEQLKAIAIKEFLNTSPVEGQNILQKSISLKRNFNFWNMTYFQFVATIGAEIADALSYAHQNGIVHGDLKPSNVLLTNEAIPMVVDFGLSRDITKFASLKKDGFSGTLVYAAPEQIKDNIINEKTDIWSIGVTLYELLSFRNPFMDATVKKIVYRILNPYPTSLKKFDKNITAELEAIVFKCLERKPEDRYKNIIELSQDLKNYLEGKPVKAKPVGVIGKTRKWIKRHPVLSVFIYIFFVSAIIGSFLTYKTYTASLLKQGSVISGYGGEENYKKAILCYEKALFLSSNLPFMSKIREEAFEKIGVMYSGLKQKDRAIQYYQKSLEVNPKNLWALRGMATIYMFSGKYKESLECQKRILSINPNDVVAITSYSRLLCQLDESDNALNFLAAKCKLPQIRENNMIKFAIYVALSHIIKPASDATVDFDKIINVLESRGFDKEYIKSVIDYIIKYNSLQKSVSDNINKSILKT